MNSGCFCHLVSMGMEWAELGMLLKIMGEWCKNNPLNKLIQMSRPGYRATYPCRFRHLVSMGMDGRSRAFC
jgi:Zn-finger nucleic acid-binding protein